MSDSSLDEFTIFPDQEGDPHSRRLEIRPYLSSGRVQVVVRGHHIVPIDPEEGFGIVLDKSTAVDVAAHILVSSGASSAPFKPDQLVLDHANGNVYRVGAVRHFSDAGWFVTLYQRDGRLIAVARPADDFELTDAWPVAIGDYYQSTMDSGDPGKVYKVVEISPHRAAPTLYTVIDKEGKKSERAIGIAAWYRRVKVRETVELVATPVWTVVDTKGDYEVRA